jgi:hypothetical protein
VQRKIYEDVLVFYHQNKIALDAVYGVRVRSRKHSEGEEVARFSVARAVTIVAFCHARINSRVI